MHTKTRLFYVVLLFFGLGLSPPLLRAATDPLPSWREGSAKQAIFSFVEAVTRQGKNFVPEAERVAVFDNDGTLWSEQPLYFQLIFTIDQVKAAAAQHPEWASNPAYQAIAKNDVQALAVLGKKPVLEILAQANTGMSTEEYEKSVEKWIGSAKHPRFKKLYRELTFQPMQELMAYLRANRFKTFIVSGGGIEFMRPWTEKTYEIPPEQVVGSSIELKYEMRDGKPVLIREPKIHFIDDGPGKPVGIQRYIGRRPIAAFGNSDGDLQMLQWTAAGSGARLLLIVHHDDAEREYAYDRQSKIGKLDKAWDEAVAKGWVVISMKQDWKKVYSFE